MTGEEPWTVNTRAAGFPNHHPIIALGGGIACFTPTITEQLVVLDAATGKTLTQIHIGTVWSGPSISRGRIYVGTGSILFLKQEMTGRLYSFGLPGEDEIARMGAGSE